jgi:hypothetical protein
MILSVIAWYTLFLSEKDLWVGYGQISAAGNRWFADSALEESGFELMVPLQC